MVTPKNKIVINTAYPLEVYNIGDLSNMSTKIAKLFAMLEELEKELGIDPTDDELEEEEDTEDELADNISGYMVSGMGYDWGDSRGKSETARNIEKYNRQSEKKCTIINEWDNAQARRNNKKSDWVVSNMGYKWDK